MSPIKISKMNFNKSKNLKKLSTKKYDSYSDLYKQITENSPIKVTEEKQENVTSQNSPEKRDELLMPSPDSLTKDLKLQKSNI